MIARNKYSNIDSTISNTDAKYNSLKKDYMDSKAIYENLMSTKRKIISFEKPELIILANDSDFTKSVKRATYLTNKAAYDVKIAEFDVQIAAAKLVMDKAKLDFNTYAKSDDYKLNVQKENLGKENIGIKEPTNFVLDNQKKNQTIYLYIGGAAIVGLGLLFLLKK